MLANGKRTSEANEYKLYVEHEEQAVLRSHKINTKYMSYMKCTIA